MVRKSVRRDQEISDLPLTDYILEGIGQYGDAQAMVDDDIGRSITFKQVHDQVRKCALALYKVGVRKGDVVALCAPNCIEHPIIIMGTAACGSTLALCNPSYTEGEMLCLLKLSKPRVVFVHGKAANTIQKIRGKLSSIQEIYSIGKSEAFTSFSSLLETETVEDLPEKPIIDVKNDVALLPYSSGTTGLPKGVMLTHRNFVSSFNIFGLSFGWDQNSVCCLDRPMYHLYGVVVAFICLQSGIKLVLQQKFEIPKLFASIQKYKITHLPTVPPLIIELCRANLHTKFDLSTLKRVICAGSTMAPSLISRVEYKYSLTYIPVYAMTEAVCITCGDPHQYDQRSVGTVSSNTTIKICKNNSWEEIDERMDGEIVVKGPQVMKGYYKNDEATSDTLDGNGWMRTGDIGHFDSKGMLYIVGRLKEVIKFKMFQVPPAEIESVLLEHPNIIDAGVIGIPDPEMGYLPKAFVVRKDSMLKEDEIIAFIGGKLSDYKHLRGGVEFVDSIPKSSTGKIDRKHLQRMQEEMHAQ